MVSLNFISLAVSVFFTNFILITIIKIFTRKRIVPLIIISIADIGSILGYLVNLFLTNFDVVTLLYTLGNIIGIAVAYIATLMMILENVTLFKSRRAREFERGINNKEGTSIPRNIIASICLGVSTILLVYGIINLSHYNSKLLFTTIGVLIGALATLCLAVYFFVSGRPTHKKIKAQNLLFVLILPEKTILYGAESDYQEALGKLNDIYIIDEYGLLITPTHSYIVKGMKSNSFTKELEENIKMLPVDVALYQNALVEFNKYQRKKITIDEAGKIISIRNIK